MELGTAENTTQALVVDLAEVILAHSLNSPCLGVCVQVVLSRVGLGRHRHLGQRHLRLLMTLLVHLLLVIVIELATLLRMLPLAMLARVSSRSRRRLVVLMYSSMLRMLPKVRLLPLLLSSKLSQQLEEREQELALLGAEVLAELLERRHVLLDLFSFLVASELKLVDTLKHVSLALLPRLELANVESAATERFLGRLHSGSLSIFDTLEADKSKAKHGSGAVSLVLARAS